MDGITSSGITKFSLPRQKKRNLGLEHFSSKNSIKNLYVDKIYSHSKGWFRLTDAARAWRWAGLVAWGAWVWVACLYGIPLPNPPFRMTKNFVNWLTWLNIWMKRAWSLCYIDHRDTPLSELQRCSQLSERWQDISMYCSLYLTLD